MYELPLVWKKTTINSDLKSRIAKTPSHLVEDSSSKIVCHYPKPILGGMLKLRTNKSQCYPVSCVTILDTTHNDVPVSETARLS